MNRKCQTRPGFDTFGAKSADSTGLFSRPITRAGSFDDLVGGEQKLWRNGQPERFGGSKINHQIVFGWLLIGQIDGLLAAQDAIDIGGRATIKVGPIRAVANQPSVYHVHTVGIDGW